MKIDKSGIENILNTIQKENHTAQENVFKSTVNKSQDKIKLSQEAKEYSSRGRAVKEVSLEVAKAAESEKLMRLKNEISQGTYRVSSEDIASAMMGINKNR